MRKNVANKVLRDLNQKMQARSNGVLAFFRQAGFEQETPDIKTLYTISQVNPEIYNSIMKLLYEVEESANALGWADWASTGADALKTFFEGVSDKASGGTESVDAEAKAKAEAEAKAKADAEAKKTKTVTIVIVVVIAIVMVIGGLVYFKGKK